MANIFFIGDTHFGHYKILEFEKQLRPFANIEEHDEALIDNWNKVVSKRDVVYHLGDVVLGNSKVYTKLSRLKGIKKLILGNHDKFNQLQPYFINFYAAKRFANDFLLTHIPIHPGQLEFRFKYNIHGHLHSKKLEDPRYINVSAEQIGLTPIAFDALNQF